MVWLEDASMTCDCGEEAGVDIRPDEGYCRDDETRTIRCDYCGRTWTLRLALTPTNPDNPTLEDIHA